MHWSEEIQAVVFSTSSDKYNCLTSSCCQGIIKRPMNFRHKLSSSCPTSPTAAIVLPHVPPSDRYELGTALVHQ